MVSLPAFRPHGPNPLWNRLFYLLEYNLEKIQKLYRFYTLPDSNDRVISEPFTLLLI